MFGSGMTTLIISNKEIKNIMKKVKSLAHLGLSKKGVSETIENEAKKRKGGFLGMLLNKLGASLLGSTLVDKGGIRAGRRTTRVDQEF